MFLIYESKFSKTIYDEEKSRLVTVYFPETVHLTDELYKEEFLKSTESVKDWRLSASLKSSSQLLDMRNFFYVIVPELQEWHNQNVFPEVMALQLKEAAIVVSPDIFAQISVQQTVADDSDVNFISKIFDNEGEAITWLDSKLKK